MPRMGDGLTAVATVIAAGLLVAGCGQDNSAPNVTDAVLADPSVEPTASAMKGAFPDDYQGLVKKITEAATAGGDQAKLVAMASDEVKRLTSAHAPLIAQAPHAELTAYRDAVYMLMRQVQLGSPALCGPAAVGKVLSAEKPPAAMQGPFDNYAAAVWRAAAAGRDHPAGRKIEPLSKADKAILDKQLRANFAALEEIKPILDGADAILKATPEMQCKIVVRLYEALGKLPAEDSDRIVASLVANAGS